MRSIWTQTAQLPQFAPLQGDRKTEVLIIGGGIAGIFCAHLLFQAGADILLVEARQIGGGITKNTTAKITAQHGLCYDKLLRTFGAETARRYLEANLAALAHFRALCQDIDCCFEEKDSYVYALDSRKQIDRELTALTRLGFGADSPAALPLPFPVAGAVCFPRQAQFHPLRFLATLAKGLPVFEQTRVLHLTPHRAVTTGGTITAQHIIVATHFPMLNRHGG